MGWGPLSFQGHGMEDITVELDQELLYLGMLEAHKQNITFNQWMNAALKKYLETLKDNGDVA